jgi:Flp pilus assembly protein protease CpaA
LIVSDLRIREFSHIDTVAFNGLAVIGLLARGFTHEVSLVPSLLAGLAATVVAIVFYQLGLLGGGDVKLVFAIAALLTRFGSTAWLVYLGILILAGGVVLVRGLRLDSAGSARGWPLGPVLLSGVPLGLIVATAVASG